ncbi:class I SAM-dependent methyltransferase [Aurantivibrio infirmus]
MNKDFFAHKADSYEKNRSRVANVENIANAILDKVKLNKAMVLMDFGSGTGLLLEKIAPTVKKITAVDISASMNRQLAEKRELIECELEILELDLTKSTLDQQFDGIISSMTMHHVQDIDAMFVRLYSLLRSDGIIAIADLDLEDGSFHTEDTGVFHSGFDRQAFIESAAKAGFKNLVTSTASTVHKEQGDYTVFLLTGEK